MFTTNVPKYFRGKAILTASYLINRMPTRVLQYQTPIEVLKNCYPNIRLVSSLPPKFFGYIVFINTHAQNKMKLDPRAPKCLFLEYSSTQNGYKCYSPITKRFYVSMDVTFLENQAYFPKTQLQGVISRNSSSDQFWDIAILADIALPAPIFKSATSTIPVTISKSSPETTIVPFKPDSAPNLPANLTSELWVYSRRKVAKDIQTPMPSAHGRLTEPNPDPHDQNSSNTVTDTNPAVLNDLDVPIAFRKGVRSCTTHPIADFVSYERLSPQFRAFTANLSKVDIPRDIH